MKQIILLWLIFVQITITHQIGYSNLIKYGSNKFVVGRNIHNYLDYTVYNIDNTADDYIVIKNAITNIVLRGGGEIFIKSGIYNLDRSLYLGNRVHLRGEGINKTILRLKNYSPAFIDDNSKKTGFIKIKLAHSAVISDLTLDGNKFNQKNDYYHHFGRHGVFFEGSTHIWINNIKSINWQGNGLSFRKYSENDEWGQYLTISNSIIENNNLDGIVISQIAKPYIVNSLIKNNGGHGIHIKIGSNNITINNNNIRDNGYGYYAYGGCGVMIQNNRQEFTNLAQIFNNNMNNNFRASLCSNDAHHLNINYNSINSCNCYILTETFSSIINNNNNQCNKTYTATKGTFINITANYDFKHLNKDNMQIYVSNNLENIIPCVKHNNLTYNYPPYYNETDDSDIDDKDENEDINKQSSSTGYYSSTGFYSSTGTDEIEHNTSSTKINTVQIIAIVVPIVIVIIVSGLFIKYKCIKK